MKIRDPIYEGRRGVKLADEEDLSPENPRVSTPPPSSGRTNPKPSRSTFNLSRSVPCHRKPFPLRNSRLTRRPRGAKLADEEEFSPEKARSETPPSSSSLETLPVGKTVSPAALPGPVAASVDRSDPKIFRRLPHYFKRYRTLPDWMNVGAGVLVAGIFEAAPSEDSMPQLCESEEH